MPSRTSYEERERRRREFYKKHKDIKRPSGSTNDSSFDFTNTVSLRKLVGPLALICYAFAILFSFAWLITRGQSIASSFRMDAVDGSLEKITLPQNNKIYKFNLAQTFEAYSAPVYSELEIELLDEQFGHVYTFYKDLWQEFHPNDAGGSSLYSDTEMSFEISIEKKGTYYLRAVSHNGNTGMLRGDIYQKNFGGHLYFGFYALFFIGLSVITYLGKEYWGSPSLLLTSIPKFAVLKTNKLFVYCLIAVTVLFIGSIVVSFTHYGYASGGDEKVIPTYFYATNNVIYIG